MTDFFFISALYDVLHCLLVSMICNEKSVIQLIVPYVIGHFSLFVRFSLALWFPAV